MSDLTEEQTTILKALNTLIKPAGCKAKEKLLTCPGELSWPNFGV